MEDNALEVLDKVLFWLVQLVLANEATLVTRKLCTALAVYFIQSAGSWQRCIRHLMCCFHASTVLHENVLDAYATDNEVLSTLSLSQVITTLYFANALAEEVGKTSPDSIRTYDEVSLVSKNIF